MRWLSFDKTTCGIIISIALAVPLSIIANLVTPAIRNWWAERSAAALRERISNLEKESKTIEGLPLFSGEHFILLKIAQVTGLCVLLMMLCFVGIVMFFIEQLPHAQRILASVLILISAASGGLLILLLAGTSALGKSDPVVFS